MKNLERMQSVAQEWDSISSAVLPAIDTNRHPLPHEQIEPDVVFYIGLGDRFDDDRRRIRSA